MSAANPPALFFFIYHALLGAFLTSKASSSIEDLNVYMETAMQELSDFAPSACSGLHIKKSESIDRQLFSASLVLLCPMPIGAKPKWL